MRPRIDNFPYDSRAYERPHILANRRPGLFQSIRRGSGWSEDPSAPERAKLDLRIDRLAGCVRERCRDAAGRYEKQVKSGGFSPLTTLTLKVCS